MTFLSSWAVLLPKCLGKSSLLEKIHSTRTLLQRQSVSLAWRLDRERRRRLILHETVFTRWRFITSYFVDVDTFSLYLNWFSRRVRDDRKYVCGRRLYACINSRASIPEKLHHCQRSTKWFTWHIISIIVENKPHAHHKTPFAYNESLQRPTIAVCLKFFFFFDHSVVFTCSKVINAFKR